MGDENTLDFFNDFLNYTGRSPASIEVMKRSFPNYFKRYQADPAMMNQAEHYKNIMSKEYQPISDLSQFRGIKSSNRPSIEVLKDIFGDPQLRPENVYQQALKKYGFQNNELPIIEQGPDENPELYDSHGYFAPSESAIYLNKLDDSESLAASLIHELQHAKDLKEGYKGLPNSGLRFNDISSPDAINREMLNRSDEIYRNAYKGHHKNFDYFNYDYPQYEIARENILQGDPVHQELLKKYPDLYRLQQEYKKNPKKFADARRIYSEIAGNYNNEQSQLPEETYTEKAKRRFQEQQRQWEASKYYFDDLKKNYIDKNRSDISQFYEPEYQRTSNNAPISDRIRALLQALGE